MAGRAHGAGRGASVSDPREHYCDEAQTQAHHHLLEPPSGKTTTPVQERANQMER